MSETAMNQASEVLVSREGAIVTLTLNRTRAKNSLNQAVFNDLRARLAQLRRDDAVRAG
ncbi:MAG: 2,3-dehydroadipyl-CoA hydratase, partial [Proteobacteria bacterium]|nr:2,3-dehydroadipyl-CoA hydratase [Pseudomonadota bacterium]